jgi:YaiO family outer membrane protein
MILVKKNKCCLFIAFITTFALSVTAQNIDTITSDGLLQAARQAAFENKNYDRAKNYLFHALTLSPHYGDVKIFLGRIYTWTNNNDSARFCFREVLKSDPGYEDASVAFSDLEYWSNNNQKSFDIISAGLIYHPVSEALLIRKARILSDMRRYKEADIAIRDVLNINRNNTDARVLAARIKELTTVNKIGLTYDYVYFDKQFGEPWHLASLDYTRSTGIGSIIGRINYANRFNENGLQYELEAYPRISKIFYSYVNAGYSDNVGIFPHWRGGFSLYMNLPKSFEVDLGFRYLQFSGDPTWIYTGYLGKYYKSWLFGVRTYLTPGNITKTVSASYMVSAKYYYGTTGDEIGIIVGYGISPDDRSNSIQLRNAVELVAYKAGVSFKKKLLKSSAISIDANWFNQEYLPKVKGDQYQLSIGLIQRF